MAIIQKHEVGWLRQAWDRPEVSVMCSNMQLGMPRSTVRQHRPHGARLTLLEGTLQAGIQRCKLPLPQPSRLGAPRDWHPQKQSGTPPPRPQQPQRTEQQTLRARQWHWLIQDLQRHAPVDAGERETELPVMRVREAG